MINSSIESLAYIDLLFVLVVGFVIGVIVCVIYSKVKSERSYYAMMQSYERDLIKKRSKKKP